jgi:GYF domain 2
VDGYDGVMHYFYSILIGLLSAFLCARYAKKRGRHPVHWFVWGALFGLFALLVLFLLPPKKMAQAASTQPIPVPVLQVLDPMQACKLWYYLDGERQQYGPMSFDGLNRAWKDGKVHVQSFVWNDELENWKRLEEVATIFHKK